MLDSVKISRRQSEIRQQLAGIVGKDKPTEDETATMEGLDAEYRANETRYRAALIAEDAERARGQGRARDPRRPRVCGPDRPLRASPGRARTWTRAARSTAPRPRSSKSFEPAAAIAAFRCHGLPWNARTGETVASGTPDPVSTRPIIDRLFPDSVAARMGAQLINIDSGSVEYPVATAGATVGWQSSETGAVGTASAYATVDRPLAPDHTLGVQMKLTRKSLKQSGDALEQAVRRDMKSAMAQEMDRVVFLGSGSGGEPDGIIALSDFSPAPFNTVTEVNADADWEHIKSAVVGFMTANAVNGPGGVKMLIRPETWAFMDGTPDETLLVTEWEKLTRQIPATNIVLTSNALAAPTSSPIKTEAVLTTSAGGVPPIFVGVWGAVDMIRDPYSDAASGGLRLTALATLDVTYSRGAQIAVLTDLVIA